MPKEGLCLGTAGQDSGSCDSMVSTNSNLSEVSDNSYDHLSVEEKECLLFLEETIDSLDTEADSGVSADETDYAERSKLPRTWPKRDAVPKNLDNGSPTESFAQRQGIEQKGEKRVSLLSSSAPGAVSSAGYHSLPRNVSAASVQATPKASVGKTADFTDGPTPMAQTGKHSWKMPKRREIEDQSNDQPSVSTQTKPPSLEFIILQPPKPFQDPSGANTRCLAKPGQVVGSESELHSNHLEAKGKATEAIGNEPEVTPSHSAPGNARLPLQKETKPCEKGRERATMQGSHEKLDSEASLDSSAKQGPPTAPKPRKLPPNIILKHGRVNTAPILDPNHNKRGLSPSSPKHKSSTSECSPEMQERARWEALEKLGLLQDKGRESKIHVLRPVTTPKPKDAQVLTSRAGSRENLNSDDRISGPAHKKPDPPLAPSLNPAHRAASGSREMIKSNSLERSGIGLSHEDQNMDSSSLSKTPVPEKMAPSVIRNSRPRPVSLGTGKDFVELKASKMDKEELETSEKHKSYPLQKFPRPTCVSVKITPKGATNEHRREALKKLGLLKE